jgi:hypothetical protein
MAFKGDTAVSAARSKVGKRVEVIGGEEVCWFSVFRDEEEVVNGQWEVKSAECRVISDQ